MLICRKSSWGTSSLSQKEIISMSTCMTQGGNRYPNSKAPSYTMFFKYVHDRINNKNESTTMRDRPVAGVSLYQQVTPVNCPPVAGTNFITEDMITCCKCGRRGNRSLLCPKSNGKSFQGMQFIFTQGLHPPFSGQFTHPSWILIHIGPIFNYICNH